MIINGKNHDKHQWILSMGNLSKMQDTFSQLWDQCFLWVSASESEDWLCLKIG
jgi:hypothetical protein